MEVVRYIKNILDILDFSIDVVSASQGLGQTRYNVCKTYHARKGSIIIVNGTEYEALSVVYNEYIIIEGEPAGITKITVKTPNYFHGTAMAVNAELDPLDKSLKFPMVYCYEIIPERFYDEPDSVIDRDAELRLYFLDNANFKDWTTQQHYDYVIDGMKSLQVHMLEKFKSCPKIGKFDTHDVINHVKFGVWTDQKGHTSNLFNENLSGVELLINLPLLKNFCDQFDNCN